MNIKTRFAPSPTGDIHIGNIRTAFYAWLFARKKSGKFLLRIEDTNAECIVDSAVEKIIEGMRWLNLDWDEGPYFQTHRIDRYKTVIKYMIANEIAYKCYCSMERLQLLRTNQIKNGEKPKYDRYCRMNNFSSMKGDMSVTPYVVRFCNPQSGTVRFCDQIRGMITFNNSELDDLIICRADGSPTYNFCVVIDDMDMNITHVIRGEEHINNTPRQINILKALNASIPIYAHIPMILDTNRKKISKRHGALGIMEYRDSGFLPEAMLNYLMRLGCSHKNQEIFNMKQMKQYFDLKKINKSASIFDFKKLLWFNRYYINHLPTDSVAHYLSWHMKKNDISLKKGPKLIDVVKLYSKRSYTLKEIALSCRYLYEDIFLDDNQIVSDYLTPQSEMVLEFLKAKLNDINNWAIECIKSIIIEIAYELKMQISQIKMIFRVVLTGCNSSPEISMVAYFIGKDCVLNRINQAIEYIKNNRVEKNTNYI